MKIRNNRLRYWRIKAKMSQIRFCKIINIPQPQLSRYERQVDQPRDDTCFERILPGLEKLFPDIKYDDLWKWKYIEKDG